MSRFSDIDPGDIDPDTGAPYANYSSPALDEPADGDACRRPGGHKWVCTGTAYGGDDDRWHGEGRCYCEHCGADGDG